MKNFFKILFQIIIIIKFSFQLENPYKKYFENIPFNMPEIKAPFFQNYSINIKDFGAIGDGKTLCTSYFSKAINFLSEKGGGKLIIPAGIYFTGPIELKSNINLHLEYGAIIQFSEDENLYPIIKTSYEGLDQYRCQSPLSALNATNISITGNGAIDGNGHFWRGVYKSRLTDSQWKEVEKRKNGKILSGTYWVPSEGYAIAEEKSRNNIPLSENNDIEELNFYKRFLRPVMISLRNCTNILLQGITFQNSPAWNLHPLMCENIIIDSIFVKNPSYAINGDAIDLESCKNALIINSIFDAGDDGICIKSGKDKDGRKRRKPCENVIIDGCTVFSGHGGFVVGSEMSGDVRNIKVSNCQFLGTDNGLRFKSTRGRGGVVENIYIENISMKNIINDAITFNLYYFSSAKQIFDEDYQKLNIVTNMKVDETTPIFRNIYIKDIICDGANRAMEFTGLPEMPIDGIFLKNINIIAKNDAVFTDAKNIIKENVNITINKN